MPIVEHPAAGAIHRVYPIGRIDRTLDDLENKRNYLHAVEGSEEARVGAGLLS
jgi:hypothetical protein